MIPPKKTEEKIQRILQENEKQIMTTRILTVIPKRFDPETSMEQLKCTKYLKMTQLMNFQYGQLFQTLELRHTIWQST